MPRRLLWALGPGLMVMLADTDAGSVVTAAQSGAAWGYRLLLVQVLLVPVLYGLMLLVARLGLETGRGLAGLIRDELGPRWAAVAVGALAISVVGALVTELAGIAGVGELFGVPAWATVAVTAALLLALVCSGGYRRVEVVGIALGLFELAFVAAAVLARPHPHEVAAGLVAGQPLGDPRYAALLAANVGAVVMPWMLFYQQSAVVDKGLTRRDLRAARVDTLLGTVLTQVVMAAVLVAAAATLHGTGAHRLGSVGQIAAALTPFLGHTAGRIVLALGVAGAALVASIVVSLAIAWAAAEALGKPCSLDESPRRAPFFYALYASALALGSVLVLASPSLVQLSIAVEVLHALLLPLVVALVLVLADRRLQSTPVRRRL
ncbi:MAG TPA: divalent metal cation transporter, partial [Gaiellaceae bacterium]|nr:divalent metal cation transporter [Gaiellaceae bacterium]